MTDPIALVGARLIDGRGGDPVDDATVVIDGERIAAVGPSARVKLPRGARRVDVAGQTVLPGLIDCHVHLLSHVRPIQEEHAERLAHRYYRGIPWARKTLECGVTTVRDAGMTPAGLRDAIAEGLFPGPRMQVSVNIVSQTGGHGDFTQASGLDAAYLAADMPSGIADSPDEMRKVVRTMIRAGADWIKLCTTGGVLSPLDPPDTPQFTIEEISVAVEEARAARLKGVLSHAIGHEGIRNAVLAGVRSIEHGYMIDEATMDLMVEHGAYLVPTVHALRSVRERADEAPDTFLPASMAKLDVVTEAQRRTLPMAIAKGVKIALGTDAGVGWHGTNAREIGLLVEYGMTPMQAILAGTSVAAELLGIDDETGTLTAGRLADLIVVDHDPLADPDRIGNPDTVRIVAKAGIIAKDMDGRIAAG